MEEKEQGRRKPERKRKINVKDMMKKLVLLRKEDVNIRRSSGCC
jgi:hypothetical protein